MSGLGADALRLVPTGADHRMDLAALARAVAEDRRRGLTPFFVAGTAGTVDVGAIDDLAGLADLSAAEGLWLHVDGAFGALAMLSPELRPRLCGIEQADSIAFDFHKWGQVPYDAGCILVRDGELHRQSFASEPPYLARVERGLGAGAPWFCDYGPDLSRGFRALKVWFTLKEHGAARIGESIRRTCELAGRLAGMVDSAPGLRRCAPVPLNIVCFRYEDARLDGPALDGLNRDLVADLQESGIAAPSTTVLNGSLVIRAAIVNHRTEESDLARMVEFLQRHGAELAETRLAACCG